MGRRELREELQSTWTVYEPREPGTPIRKKDVADANTRQEAFEADRRNRVARQVIKP